MHIQLLSTILIAFFMVQKLSRITTAFSGHISLVTLYGRAPHSIHQLFGKMIPNLCLSDDFSFFLLIIVIVKTFFILYLIFN